MNVVIVVFIFHLCLLSVPLAVDISAINPPSFLPVFSPWFAATYFGDRGEIFGAFSQICRAPWRKYGGNAGYGQQLGRRY